MPERVRQHRASQRRHPSPGSRPKPGLVVGISGGTGTVLGVRLLELAREMEVATHLGVSATVSAGGKHDADLRRTAASASGLFAARFDADPDPSLTRVREGA